MSDLALLGQIAQRVRLGLRKQQKREPLDDLKRRIQSTRRPTLPFRGEFLKPGPHVIAEVKLASPSEGIIVERPRGGVERIAHEYAKNGATAISVLTEPEFFRGHPEYLRKIRDELPEMPLLMKDFVIDDYQLYRARADGADCILLILALLSDSEARALYETAKKLDLTALVEVHDSAEMARARALGAELIGVNNRDLRTMEVSLRTSVVLAREAPESALLISESGLKSGKDLRLLSEVGFRGFLIGTQFMKSDRPGEALARLLKEAV